MNFLNVLSNEIVKDLMLDYEISELASMNLDTLIKAETYSNYIAVLEDLELKPVEYIVKWSDGVYEWSIDNNLYINNELYMNDVYKIIYNLYSNPDILLVLSGNKVYKISYNEEAQEFHELFEDDVLALNNRYMIKRDSIILMNSKFNVTEVIRLNSPIVRIIGKDEFNSYAVDENNHLIAHYTTYSNRLIADYESFQILNYPNIIDVKNSEDSTVYIREDSIIVNTYNQQTRQISETILMGHFDKIGFMYDEFDNEVTIAVGNNVNYISTEGILSFNLPDQVIKMGQHDKILYSTYFLLQNGDLYIDDQLFRTENKIVDVVMDYYYLWLLFDNSTVGMITSKDIHMNISNMELNILPTHDDGYKQIYGKLNGVWLLTKSGSLIKQFIMKRDMDRYIELNYNLKLYQLKTTKRVKSFIDLSMYSIRDMYVQV